MILPFVKLGTLVLKTVCKPIASRLKVEAGKHPKFRQLIIDFAQVNHRFTTTMQRRIYGHATDVEIRPLNEEKAVQAAADLLGELFVFTVAGAAVIFEVQRSARSEARKEELRRQELEAMRQRDEELYKEVEQLKEKLAELEQLAKGKGLSGLFTFRNNTSTVNAPAEKPTSLTEKLKAPPAEKSTTPVEKSTLVTEKSSKTPTEMPTALTEVCKTPAH